MKANEEIIRGQDLTPPLLPLSFSLYDSSLSSRCSSCFLSLPSSSPPSPSPSFLRYCSCNGVCSVIDAPLHFSSAEHHLFLLLRSNPSLWPYHDSSDLRLSLRLLLSLSISFRPPPPLPPRLAGLLTNRNKLVEEEEYSARVRVGARVMAMARAMRDGREFDDDYELEEAVLCLVITNGVEIQLNGDDAPIGIGVYDWRFSWINHSCCPNSCYRFVSAFEADSIVSDGSGVMRIVPGGDGAQMEDFGVCATFELANRGIGNYGPRVIVRSIKAIQRDDQVTITYTDLLQTTTLRRSELSLKYQFICNCRRCNAVPQTYVDSALQETFSTSHNSSLGRSFKNHYEEEAVEKLRDMFNSTIEEYMEVGDPVSCCERIECLLSQGLFNQHLEETKRASHIDLRLSPLHHLSLNAYTTLSSTYKICSTESINGKQFHSFDMSRFSAAYSLVLAGATHHLFLSEPSLIACAGTFWKGAGESLLCLARSSSWNLFPNSMLQNLSSRATLKCPMWLLMDKFENKEFDQISQAFLMCVSTVTPKVWSFLVQGCQYLKDVKDPINFSWLLPVRTADVWDFSAPSRHDELYLRHGIGAEGDLVKFDNRESTSEARTNIFQLGVHCLMYGDYLSCICNGYHPCTTNLEGLTCGIRDKST